MISEMDRAFIYAALDAFTKDKDGNLLTDSEAQVRPYKLIADKIMKLCPSERPQKYTTLGGELVPIAEAFGVRDLSHPVSGDNRTRAEIVAEQRKSLGQGDRRSLTGPILYWLWKNHPLDASDIFMACGFDAAAATETIEARRPTGSLVAVEFQNRNKIDLSYLLANAAERVILMAQNHWQIVSQKEGSSTDFWPKIESAILRGVTIEIVAMHEQGKPPMPSPDAPDAIELWSLYMKAPAFRSHVARCWATLDRFAQKYAELGVSGKSGEPLLKLHKAYFSPLSLALMDPSSDEAIALVSPRTANEVSGTRPEFIIRRKETPDIFLYYAAFAENALVNQGYD